ncbi:MAG: SMI1/KNR4 family protein [Planctomycetaceae bacterium]
MPPADVLQIEARLGAALPDDYRAFLIDYPADAPDDLRRYGLFEGSAAIVDETLVFRRYLTDDATRERYVVIGDIGCGDRVCLDQSTNAVLLWSHVEEDFAPLANCVADYYRLAITEAT